MPNRPTPNSQPTQSHSPRNCCIICRIERTAPLLCGCHVHFPRGSKKEKSFVTHCNCPKDRGSQAGSSPKKKAGVRLTSQGNRRSKIADGGGGSKPAGSQWGSHSKLLSPRLV